LLSTRRRRTTVFLPGPCSIWFAASNLECSLNPDFQSQCAASRWRIGLSQDRRRSRRVKVGVAARIRPCYDNPNLSEELLTATNVSRDGFYFISRRSGYRANMNLYVACPAGHSRTPSDAECARVVRVEPMADAWGVAVTYLRSANMYHGGFPSQR
jgi:hypothetical protein